MNARFLLLALVLILASPIVAVAQDAPDSSEQRTKLEDERARRVEEHENKIKSIIEKAKDSKAQKIADEGIASAIADSEESNALAERFKSLMKLFTTRETEKILAEFTEPFSITSPTASGATDKASLEEYFTDIYKKDVGYLQRIEIDPGEVVVTSVDSSHALLSGTSNDKYISREGYEFKMTSHWDATARRVGDDWKFVTLNHTTDVLRNPMYREAVDRSRMRPLVSGITGLIIGVIGGWAFFTLRAGSKKPA